MIWFKQLLYKETQKLYETLSVLKFYQDNFESIKSDITQDDLEEKLEQANEVEMPEEVVVVAKEEIVEPIAVLENETQIEETEPEVEEEVIAQEEIKEETVVEEELEELVFKPIFELEVEDEEVIETASDTKHVALEDLLGENYVEPVFVKPNEVSLFPSETTEEEAEEEPKTTTLNDATSKSITIGLNDRIGFVQHLFNDSNEDFNRVISQLNTFDTFEEAKNFINEMVIPDYNYWVGKEDYLERFMEIVEKKFN